MLLNTNSRLKSIIPSIKLLYHATMCTSRKAVVRKLDHEPCLSLSFVFSSPLVKERQFNFVRQQTEKLQIVCERITSNIKKQGEKKIKKLSGKANSPSEIESLRAGLKDLENVSVYLAGIRVSGDVENKVAFQEGAVLKIADTEFKIQVNPPTVVKLSLPKNIMAGFTVCPRVELEFADFRSTKFIWFRSEKFSEKEQNKEEKEEDTTDVATTSNPKEGKVETQLDTSAYNWEKVGEGYTYTSTPDDVHRYLKINCIPISVDGYFGQNLEAVSSVLVASGPGPCPFEKRHLLTQNPTKIGRFRVLSYNILADLYADSNFSRTELFSTCPPYALAIDYRKQLLLKEIQGYNGDLLCLQEVDTKIFDHLLLPTLQVSNYEGIFTPKAGKVAEGLACFYNKSKFSLVSHHDVILGKALESEPAFEDFLTAISKNETLKTKIAELKTVLQIVILKSLDLPNQKLCVANIHLYSKPEWCNIRLIQTGLCLRHLEQAVALEKAQDPNCSVALLFTGDFNSSPEYGVYQFITTQFIPDDHPDWKSDSEDIIENFCLTHPFHLTSACGTPPYTNFTLGFTGCLDYIFTDDSHLCVEEVVPLPNHEELAPYMGLPSITMPSDHLALVCTLKWL